MIPLRLACYNINLKLTRMTRTILIIPLLLLITVLTTSKPVYNHKTSYITQLTNFNFKDQVTKIRQNTNYVAIVHFYKFNGNSTPIQMENHKPLPHNLINGSINTMVSSESEPSIVINIPKSAKIKVSMSSPPSKSILPHLSPPPLLLKISLLKKYKNQPPSISIPTSSKSPTPT